MQWRPTCDAPSLRFVRFNYTQVGSYQRRNTFISNSEDIHTDLFSGSEDENVGTETTRVAMLLGSHIFQGQRDFTSGGGSSKTGSVLTAPLASPTSPGLFNFPTPLLVDGYISQTFKSRAAEQYFLNLLKCTSTTPYVTWHDTDREEVSFFVHSVPPHIPVLSPKPTDRWLLDRGIIDRGTVVPQTIWSPLSAADIRQYVENAELQMPVFFEDKDGGLGLSLEASTDGQCHVLRDGSDPAPLGQKSTTHIRIVVSMVSVDLLTFAEFDLH